MALKERVRSAIWKRLAPSEVTEEPRPPLGVDRLAKLPVYFEPPECPLCVFEENQCYDCLGSLVDITAPFGTGVESATVTHLHMHAVMDTSIQIRIPARRKLCLSCFRLDWDKVNPGVPCDL